MGTPDAAVAAVAAAAAAAVAAVNREDEVRSANSPALAVTHGRHGAAQGGWSVRGNRSARGVAMLPRGQGRMNHAHHVIGG
jgi:hypothetical protein